MLIRQIAVLGGTGFVGQSLCNRLSKEGYKLKVLTRNREYNKNLILIPNLSLVQTDIHESENLNHHIANCNLVINLVGILNEKGNNGKGFRHAHVELAEKLIAACEKNGIKRLIQMSALNADVNGSSHYLRTKGEAEDRLHSNNIGLNVTSFQPSVIFGSRDSFFNRFSDLLKITPLFFPLACHQAKFAPVYVLDVVEMIIRSIKDPNSYGQIYQLCGPKTYTLKDLVDYTASVIGLNRTVIPLNDFLSMTQAFVFDFIPGKPFSRDNYLSTKADSICSCNDLARYNISARSIESIVPHYLSTSSTQFFYNKIRKKNSMGHYTDIL